MAITEKRITQCLAAIEAVVSSPRVDQYLIGFTRLPAAKKGDQYRQHGFEHLVIIADKMGRKDALKLEGELQRRAWGAGAEAALSAKYHAEKRNNGKRFESYGGSPADALTEECSVYIAWWNI